MSLATTEVNVTSNSTIPSNVLQAFEEENKYKPVTNFEPQERVNPFDKDSKSSDTSASTSIYNKIPSNMAPTITEGSITSINKIALSGDTISKGFTKKYDYESSPPSIETKWEPISASDYKPTIPTHSPIVASSSSGYTSQSASHSASPSNGYNKGPEIKPSYSRTESTEKPSDLDIIFGENKTVVGNGKITRSGGSLSDADIIFGGPPTRSDLFGASKSMSVTTDSRSTGSSSYKIYEGIQNAAFHDFDSQTAKSSSSLASDHWSKAVDDDSDIDLK